jgi:2-amino-4-hydroxy-6-hydroxymethyldihydropteridine diphosphokinase
LKSETCYILLGSNQGKRLELLEQAKKSLQLFDIEIVTQSSICESEPWGFEAEQNFLNQVLQVKTNFSPQELLQKTQMVEDKLGRIRTANSGYTSRTIDVDILFYGSEIINSATLTIPHPRLHLRRFTLAPLAEVAPDFIHPVLKKSIKTLLAECEDESEVTIFCTPARAVKFEVK